MLQRLLWALHRVTQVLILWVPKSRTYLHVDSFSALCTTGLLHLPLYSFIFIALGKLQLFFLMGVG